MDTGKGWKMLVFFGKGFQCLRSYEYGKHQTHSGAKNLL